MLRISITRMPDGSALLRLEGLVLGRFAEELRRTCEPLLAAGSRLELDLSQVTFIDRQGIAVLRDLDRGKVVLSNPSSFVREVLRGVGLYSEIRSGE